MCCSVKQMVTLSVTLDHIVKLVDLLDEGLYAHKTIG